MRKPRKPAPTAPLRVGIANDMAMARAAMRHLLHVNSGLELAWEAHDGNEAVKFCAEDTPDLILMDLIMPGKNGAEATREIMAHSPCAILIVTAGVERNAPLVFEALGAGALDAVDTPMGLTEPGQSALNAKIRTISRLIGRAQRPNAPARNGPGQPTLVAIGASAGGPAAICTLLEQLPSEFPAAIVVVQHLDEKYAASMAEWLSAASRQPVAVAKAGERPQPGRVLLAGTNNHLVMRSDGALAYVVEPLDQPYRPSVDEFFASAALYWTGQIIGVLLTGMGQDGAQGLLTLRRLGHFTLAQDQKSSAVYGMPGTAARIGAAMAQMNPADIGRELVAYISPFHTVQNFRTREPG